jgi:Xaa-Pro aminopeptidase
VAGELETPMYGFEALTLVPFDRRLLDLTLLDAQELQWLDAYHDRVASAVGPLLSAAERAWLQQACAPLAARS